MVKMRKFILSFLFAVSVMPSAYGKTSEQIYDDAVKKGDEAFVQDKFSDATKAYSDAVSAAEKIGALKPLTIQFKLGSSYEGGKDWKNSLAAYEKGLLTSRKAGGHGSEFDIVLILNSIARVCAASGKVGAVEKVFETAFDMVLKNPVSGSFEGIATQATDFSVQIIDVYKKHKLNDAIIRHSERMLGLLNGDAPGQSNRIAKYNELIADSYMSLGKPKEAEKYYSKALAIIGEGQSFGNSEYFRRGTSSDSSVIREKLIGVLEKNGRSKEASNYKRIAQNWKNSPFDSKKFSAMMNKAYKSNAKDSAEQLAALTESRAYLSKYFVDESSYDFVDIFRGLGLYYAQQSKPALAEENFLKAMAVVDRGVSRGAGWASRSLAIVPLFELKKFYRDQKRDADLAKVEAQLAALNRPTKRPAFEGFQKEEITGPVKISITPSNAFALAKSEIKFEIHVENAKNYRPVWTLKTNSGAIEERDHRFGSLSPGVKYSSRTSMQGFIKDLNECKYSAPGTQFPSPLMLEVQILKRSNDDVLASASCPIRFTEPELKIEPGSVTMKTGESTRFTVTAKNVTDAVVLEWSGRMDDTDDPVYQGGNATLQGTFKLGEWDYGTIDVKARVRSKWDYKVLKEVSAHVHGPPSKFELK